MTQTSLLPYFCQLAYVTNDFDRAKEVFREHHGIEAFAELRDVPVDIGSGHHCRLDIALAFKDTTNIELIQPLGGDDAIFRDFLPANKFAVKFHHVGRMCDSLDEYNSLFDSYKKCDAAFPIVGGAGDCRFFYVDTNDEFGHFVEYVYGGPMHRAFMASVPHF